MNPYQEAVRALSAGDAKRCENIVSTLLNTDFDNPILLFALGMSLVAQRRNGVANALLRRAAEHMDSAHEAYGRLGIFPKEATSAERKKFVKMQLCEAYNGIALTYKYENKTDEAVQWFKRALALNPDDADVYANISTLYVNDGRPEGGIAPAMKALALKPDHKDARWNLALLQLEMENFKDGFNHYDAGLRSRMAISRTYKYPDGRELPNWDGSRKKLVLAYGEQGLGDEIMFASCIPDLQANVDGIIFDCHPRLVSLFEHSFGVKCYGTRKMEWISWPMEYQFDSRVAIGSLPKHFRTSAEQFPGTPYLKAGRSAAVDALPGFKVGISWVGGQKDTRKAVRSVDLAALLPILQQDVTLVSMQYTDQKAEIEQVEQTLGKKIYQFDFITDALADYRLTAEVVNSCDLIISVNTSLIHLTGALGKPCWTLTPSKPAWRYGQRGTGMRWYNSVQQFRQLRGEAWDGAVGRASDALADLLAQQRRLVA